MWHDKSAGLGHAGEGKMVCGMTGWGEAPRKRENSSSSEVSCGRRGKESTPEEGKGKWFRVAKGRKAPRKKEKASRSEVQGSAPSHTLSGKSSGTLELLTGVNKVPSPKEVPLRIRSAASRRGH